VNCSYARKLASDRAWLSFFSLSIFFCCIQTISTVHQKLLICRGCTVWVEWLQHRVQETSRQEDHATGDIADKVRLEQPGHRPHWYSERLTCQSHTLVVHRCGVQNGHKSFAGSLLQKMDHYSLLPRDLFYWEVAAAPFIQECCDKSNTAT